MCEVSSSKTRRKVLGNPQNRADTAEEFIDMKALHWRDP